MSYYEDVIKPLQWAVMSIQQNGILVDTTKAAAMYKKAALRQEEIADDLGTALGYKFNPNSSQQVLRLFNDDLLIKCEDSSDKLSMLKTQIKHPDIGPIVRAILAYRDLSKKKGTYLRPEPWLDGRVRSSFRLYGTLTWRLSSSDPNLQNLPRSPSQGIDIKSIYVAPPGKSLLEIDKSQLELRIPAYASNSETLIRWFENREDVYCRYASEIYSREIKGKGTERQFTKTTLLADGYGASAPKVSDTMLLQTGEYRSPKELQPFLEKLRSVTPEKYRWFNECWDYAKKHKRLVEGFGVPRLLYNAPDQLRQVAYSWPTQATASGVINRALVRVFHYLDGYRSGWQAHTKIICQVHDSLLFEVPTEALQEAIPVLQGLMDQPETIFGRTVLLPSEAKFGPNWSEMETVK